VSLNRPREGLKRLKPSLGFVSIVTAFGAGNSGVWAWFTWTRDQDWLIALGALSVGVVLLVIAVRLVSIVSKGSTETILAKEPGITALEQVLKSISQGIDECGGEAAAIIEATQAMSEEEILIASKTLGELYKDSRQQANDLQSAGELLLEVIENQRQARKETALQMQGIVQEIQKVVESINIISRDTHVLGVNARIEAAHAGDRGRGFGAVAQSLQDLNNEVQKASGRVHELSAALAKMIPSWLDQENEKDDDESKKGTQILQTAITKARARGPEIQQKLNEVLSHVQFQDILAKQLNKVILVSRCVSDILKTETLAEQNTFDEDTFVQAVNESRISAVQAGGAVNSGSGEDDFESGEVAFF
jgi:methyl-accepting chemotaxis protein